MDTFSLTTLDVIVMLLYGVLIIGYGLYHAKRNSSEDYFLAGRSMTWPIVGISLFAANISSSTLVGLASSAYQTDTHVYNYEWLAAVVLVFFAIFFMPFYLQSRVYTMPEFLERRFDSRSRYYFSFITIIGNVILDTAAGLYVGNIILKLMFPEIPTVAIIVILAFSAGAYTIPGGLNSVIHTEVVQAVLLLLGSVLLTFFAFGRVGGWAGMIDGLNSMGAAGAFAEKGLQDASDVLSLWRPTGDGWANFLMGTGGDSFMPWTGLVFGAPILGFYFWANNQFMVQRVLGAKDLNHGRWGALFAGLLKLPVIFFMVLPGTLAILIYGDFDLSAMNYALPDGTMCADLADCPNATYPLLLFDLLPKGLLGLVLAGLLAAMMSSVSATFNSASTLITMDFIVKLRPEMTSKQLVRAGQISTLVLVLLASAWAPQIERWNSLWEYLQIILSYIAPPVASVFILGLFWRRANATGAFVSLICGFVIGVILFIAAVHVDGAVADGIAPNTFFAFLNRFHFLHTTVYLLLICMIINVVVSLLTDPPGEEVVGQYTWRKEIFTAETEELKALPWYLNYRYLSVLLLLVTAIVVGYFW